MLASTYFDNAESILHCYVHYLAVVTDTVKRANSPGHKRTTKLERYRQERAAAAAGAHRGLDVAADDFYILIEVEELKYQLEVKHSVDYNKHCAAESIGSTLRRSNLRFFCCLTGLII
jgi:hypothetical protein